MGNAYREDLALWQQRAFAHVPVSCEGTLDSGLRELSLLGYLQSVLMVVYMFVSQEASHRSP